MLDKIIELVDEWAGVVVIFIVVAVAVVALIAALLGMVTEKRTPWCQPNTSICITPVVPLYCYDSAWCITAVPTAEEKAQ